ncbi:hypothetical protein HNQ59_000011 [Chitinivorax tropicus]|uniref:Condensation domain-containing protein n=1 Tax=Chitinivorax tropicus TaxID=714531 RepID=A0A840MHS7_9PROT|nr:condensation domain-containing protein [Chitinivorax tropicus]MBB5016749.1 hypothetical protein [Chitinivorax tropicus]
MMAAIQTHASPLTELNLDELPFYREREQPTRPAAPTKPNHPPTHEQQPEPQAIVPGQAYPLGYAQLCFWFVYMALGETANNLLRLMLEGELDVGRLEKALNHQLQRHDALRASMSDWNPVQRFIAWQAIDLPFQDLAGKSEREQSVAVSQLSHQLLGAPFDLAKPPLMRARLVRLGPQQHLLLLCFPHIVADGAAIHLFQQQMMDVYDRLARGERLPGREQTLQIADFARQERQRYQANGRAASAFWQRVLAKHPYARFPESMRETGRIQHHSRYVTFPGESYQQLQQLAKHHKATHQMALIAALTCVIQHLTGARQFTVNSVLESRDQAGSEDLMAPLLRVMPVPVTFHPGQTFVDLLQAVRSHILAAYEHKDCPWSVPVGLLAEQRWHRSPRAYVRLIHAGSWLFAKLFRRGQLYPRYLADYLFMEAFPPEAGWRNRLRKQPPRAERGGIPDPVININILQGVYKRDKAPACSQLRAWQLNDPRQFALSESLDSSWEDETINLYIVDTGQGKPSIRICCTNLHEQGLNRLMQAMEHILQRVADQPLLPLNLTGTSVT